MEDFRIEHRYHAGKFELKRHYENVYQVLIPLSGRIRYTVGNQCYEAGKGGILVLNTLEDHDLQVIEYPYERYLIQIRPEFFQREIIYPEIIAIFIKRPPNFSHLLQVSAPVWNYLYDIVLEMEREYNHKKKYWDCYVGADLRRMFILIYRECADILAMRVGHSVTVAYNIMNYINHHFTESITVDKIAAELYLNKNYIAHVFKEETGYSLISYAILLRANRAKVLLTKTDRSITQIATECGYDDFTYFSRQFKKTVGVSPSEYRRKNADVNSEEST